jgi:nucleoside-diphosphate-sugar epimerase
MFLGANVEGIFSQQWYLVSKILAEDAAWKFAKEKGIDLVAINPSMVIGPLLQPTLNTSAGVILKVINGICSLVY